MTITTLQEAATEINRLQKVVHHRMQLLKESDQVRDRMQDLLDQMAVILKGAPSPTGLHGWQDLPQLVQELVDKKLLREAYIKELERQLWGAKKGL